MKVAVVGCCHGELEKIYREVEDANKQASVPDGIKLVVMCGDLQTLRDEYDLQCMAVPKRYRRLGMFYKYYKGEAVAPVLTVFVGGNHEASSYLATLAYGGWVAPNIYYLGYTNVLRYGGLRIAGISGIHNSNSPATECGHFENPPYNEPTKRSVYHIRKFEAFKLLQLGDPEPSATQEVIDIFLSHDWPMNIHVYGDVQELLSNKPHFHREIHDNKLGNPMLMPILQHLRPRFWFAAHLHVRFDATVQHLSNGSGCPTRFLALDKVQAGKSYLEVIDIEPCTGGDEGSLKLQYDPTWLSILKHTDKQIDVGSRSPVNYPGLSHSVQDELCDVMQRFRNNFDVPSNFCMCDPVIYSSDGLKDCDPDRTQNFQNPQTREFCSKLGIADPTRTSGAEKPSRSTG